jgi:winged helix-turn helix protein
VSGNERPPIGVTITPEQRAVLESWMRRRTSPYRLVIRSRIVLLASQGMSDRTIAHRLEIARQTVRLWRRRFLVGGTDALISDAPGRGRKAAISATQIHAALAAGERAPSIRELARRLGTSASSTHRSVVKHRSASSEGRNDATRNPDSPAARVSQLRNKTRR